MTNDFLEQTCVSMVELFKRSSSRFDAARFSALAHELGGKLWPELGAGAHGQVVLRSYLRLLGEAVSMGCIAPAGRGHQNMLSLLLVELVPQHLCRLPADKRAACLATLWNLGEGLLQEPSWLNRYAVAMCAEFQELPGLADHLAQVLEPVLAPRQPSSWKGPCAVRVLDPRPLRDDFLPGEMHLAAPAVVCVHDRRHAHTHIGVFLDHGGKSRLLGVTPCLGESLHEGALPAVQFTANNLTVSGHEVALPWLQAPLEKLVTAAGFVLASTADSQRLWVVDTP